MSEDIFTKESIQGNLEQCDNVPLSIANSVWAAIGVALVKSIVYLADKIGGKDGD